MVVGQEMSNTAASAGAGAGGHISFGSMLDVGVRCCMDEQKVKKSIHIGFT